MSFYLFKRLASGPSVDLLYHSNTVELVVWCRLFNNREAVTNNIVIKMFPICEFLSIG